MDNAWFLAYSPDWNIKKEADMAQKIEREFIHRMTELRIRDDEIIFESKEEVIRGKKKIIFLVSKRIRGKLSKKDGQLAENFIRKIQSSFRREK